MAPGRPKGSSNKSNYHKAGGRRDGAGRPSKATILVRGQTNLGSFINNQLNMPTEAALSELPTHGTLVSNDTVEEQNDTAKGDSENKTSEDTFASTIEITEDQMQQQRVDLVAKIREIVKENSVLDGSNLSSDSEESDDESLDNYDEDQEDISFDSEKAGRRTRIIEGYMPPPGSVLFNYLKSVKDKVVKRIGMEIENGQKWIIPQMDPISRPCVGEADLWYQSEAWAYVWEPFFQFSSCANLKDMACVQCHAQGTYSSNMYCWRPMFYYDKIIWLLHRRFFCSRCKHTCAGIDPRFLSQLPTRVLDRFEFVTTVGGPGMHMSMVYMFSNLSTKGVTYGTFSNMINELQRIRYYQCQVSYLDSLSDRQRADFVSQGDPIPELKGDTYFIAKQMNLKCPPLPIVTQEEKKLYTNLIRRTPNPTKADYCDFAKEYLKHTDGINIFPKLPSMLKEYYRHWHKNQQVKAAKLAIGSDYIELQKKLSSIRVDAAVIDASRSTSSVELIPENINNPIGDERLFVPSVAGPNQVKYISTKQQGQIQRHCYWWPFCGTVDLCGGWQAKKCANYIKGDFQAITDEQLQTKKNDALNEIRRMRKKQKTKK